MGDPVSVVRQLLSSKKFVASLIGMLSVLFAKLGIIPEAKFEELALVAAPFIAYVAAQGAADVGKERIAKELEILKTVQEQREKARQWSEAELAKRLSKDDGDRAGRARQ